VSTSARLGLLAASESDLAAAQALAQQLQLPLVAAGTDPQSCTDHDALLIISGELLSLQQTGARAPGAVAVDFGSSSMRHRRGAGHNELLGRAVGLGKKPGVRVLDATAGLGSRVRMSEREPVFASLLRSGMQRAGNSPDAWLQQVLQRLSLHVGDVRNLAAETLAGVDVVYLDPIFPPRGKSAAVKKEMALFQLLLHGDDSDDDADELLLWALAQDVARVVVKRPPRAPSLANRQPSHHIAGKAVRYDVYVRRKLTQQL
jgi:16S rRNA (guanine1516-N2)-methyltransferase